VMLAYVLVGYRLEERDLVRALVLLPRRR